MQNLGTRIIQVLFKNKGSKYVTQVEYITVLNIFILVPYNNTNLKN